MIDAERRELEEMAARWQWRARLPINEKLVEISESGSPSEELRAWLARLSGGEAAESSECVACERPVCHRQDCGRFDGAGGALCADCYDDLESESR